MKNIYRIIIMIFCSLFYFTGSTYSQEDLAKKTQNPLSNLISLPFQNNTNFGIGPDDEIQNVLNIQPVIPISLNKDWNLITRTIIPLIWQPSFYTGSENKFGMGDINATAWLSPANPGKLIWGLGGILLLPTATDVSLGTGKWAIGPSLVLLTMPGNFVIGALANNIWSFAGDSDRNDVNQFLLQYFINYNLPDKWYLVSAPIITANWEAADGQQWIIPFGGGIGKIFSIGKQPINTQISYYVNVVKPDSGPDGQLRAQIQLLFPQ
jgi:hypothetical protein